jgi:thiol-disulfide isomerase/thioredoxin
MRFKAMPRSIVSFVLLLSAVAFSACNYAAPPRPVSAGSRPRTATIESAVEKVRHDEIPRPDGSSFKLADLSGKVVVVDFWATYCPPCREQAPQLAELNRRYKDKGLEVIGLSINEKKDQEEVLDFMQKVGMNYTVGYADDRLSRAFLKGTEDETGSPPIPQLFIFGRDGKLVEHLVRYRAEHGVEYLDRIVTEQLGRS